MHQADRWSKLKPSVEAEIEFNQLTTYSNQIYRLIALLFHHRNISSSVVNEKYFANFNQSPRHNPCNTQLISLPA